MTITTAYTKNLTVPNPKKTIEAILKVDPESRSTSRSVSVPGTAPATTVRACADRPMSFARVL
jgi:hypothetical protein